MNSDKMKLLVAEAVVALTPTFTQIDLQVKDNLERVLQAFRDRVWERIILRVCQAMDMGIWGAMFWMRFLHR